VAPNLSLGSYVTYEVISRRYIVPGLGGRRLDRLQARDVQTWLNELGRRCQCCVQGKDAGRAPAKRRCCAIGRCCQAFSSPATVVHVHRVLRTILAQSITEELITRNPARGVKLPSSRSHKRKSWTSEEARQFLESARADSDPLYAAYVLVLTLGLRKGEVLGLGWDDVDLAAGELAVDWQLQRVGTKLLRRATKTETSDARLPLPPICTVARSATAMPPARLGRRPVRCGRAPAASS
jgi:integrase